MAQRICLNAIVRNELANLPRMLKSVIPHIHCAVICDTGSTDGTPEFCEAIFKKAGLPCKIVHTEFKDFSQARNFALLAAKTWHQPYDYILLVDADMELVADKPLPQLTADGYSLIQRQGGLAYYNVRLVRKDSPALYHGVTHEYIGVNNPPLLNEWHFVDHATGSNRPEKIERDTRLLEGYLATHPDDARSLFYLAQTYKDAGKFKEAIAAYEKRIAVGGWDEEVFQARLNVARCYMSMGDEATFILKSLEAYNSRPKRAEPLYDLAHHYRLKDNQQQTGWLFAEAGSKITYPDDMLFVEQYMYDWGFLEEKSILGFYSDKTKPIGFAACDKLSLMKEAPQGVREGARTNLFHYLRPLKDYASSFKTKRIQYAGKDKGYNESNPCVTVHNNKIYLLLRTVNYTITPDGWYDMQGDTSIRTKNHLLQLDDNLEPTGGIPVLMPLDWPAPLRTNVMGFEDMRIFSWKGSLWTLSCCLEQNEEYWRDQWFAHLNLDGQLGSARRIDVLPKQNEKNWMPWIDGCIKCVYKPGVIIDVFGNKIVEKPTTQQIDHFSGSSQLIPFDGGYLGMVHEAWKSPVTGKRFYQHRFAYFDREAMPVKYSIPFYFNQKDIEFAVGIAKHPDNDERIIVSYGVLDREAWIGELHANDVRKVLWQE